MNSRGVLATFSSPGALIEAVETLSKAGFEVQEAYSPFPVPGLAGTLGFRGNRIAPLALLAGLIGATAAFGLQWYSATQAYPVVAGGKPLNSWPAFMPITFEVGVLAALLTAVIVMLIGNGLPRLHHPVFAVPGCEAASNDGFMLLLRDDGDALDRALRALNPLQIARVPS